MASHKTIEEFQLIRTETELYDSHTYSFMDPICAGTTWSCGSIDTMQGKKLHEYLVSVAAQSLIVATDFFHDAATPHIRYTEMRLSDMVVDSWLSAGGAPDALRFLGINWIVNEHALRSITNHFNNSTPPPGHEGSLAGVVRLTPSGTSDTPSGTSDNPFVRCAERVAAALGDVAGLRIVLKTVHMIRSEDYSHHLICEFDTIAPETVAVPEPAVPEPAQQAGNGSVKRSFSRKGRDALRRTLSHIIRR